MEPAAIADYLTDDTTFATRPARGMYRRDQPRATRLGRLATLRSAVVRDVTPAGGPVAHARELALVYEGDATATTLVIGGLDLAALPMLPLAQQHSFYQTYADAAAQSADNPYFAMLLDANGNWLDSHEIGMDGPLMYRDDQRPDVIHLMLLSFERHAIVGHVALTIPG